MNKQGWKRRALLAESAMRAQILDTPAPTFDTLTVCFSARKVTFRGRSITASEDFDCVAFPVTNDESLLYRPGYVSLDRLP